MKPQTKQCKTKPCSQLCQWDEESLAPDLFCIKIPKLGLKAKVKHSLSYMKRKLISWPYMFQVFKLQEERVMNKENKQRHLEGVYSGLYLNFVTVK